LGKNDVITAFHLCDLLYSVGMGNRVYSRPESQTRGLHVDAAAFWGIFK